MTLQAYFRTSMNICHYFRFCFKFNKGRLLSYLKNEGFSQHKQEKERK